MKRIFTLAIFFSAALLFMVQPLAGKILLPVLGGSPAVWSSCMVFFQAVLLLGYLYAHLLSTRVSPKWQLPVRIGEPGDDEPQMWLLRTLGTTVGLPFFALSASAPLLQRWFAWTNDPGADDHYFLYAASNAGSLLGLLGYLLVEPAAARSLQVSIWSVAFLAVAALVTACGRDRTTSLACFSSAASHSQLSSLAAVFRRVT